MAEQVPVETQPAPPELRRSRRLAELLDGVVEVGGVRFGLDPVLSALPVVGDAAGLVCSLYIVDAARRAGVPRRTIARMVATVALDAALGAVPVAGPLFDAAVRANERNVELFERAVRRGRAGGRG